MDTEKNGQLIYGFAWKSFPDVRCLTGWGAGNTLNILKEYNCSETILVREDVYIWKNKKT